MGQSKRDQQWPHQETRHVWVQSPEDHRPPDPGVIVEWRSWQGHNYALVIVVMERDGRTATLQRWFHQRDLAPIPTRPRSPDPSRWHQGWKNT